MKKQTNYFAIALLSIGSYLLPISQPALSDTITKIEIDEDEAIVLVRYVHVGAFVKRLIFGRAGSSDRFSVIYNKDLQVIKVKAGLYYVRGIDPIYVNVRGNTYDEPEDVDDLIQINANSVTYIGDWLVKERKPLRGVDWDIKTSYLGETMFEARDANPWLMEYPLFMTGSGMPVVPLTWE